MSNSKTFFSEISDTFFFTYFSNKTTAIAYKLKSVKLYDQPFDLNEFGIKKAPQSFQYLNLR